MNQPINRHVRSENDIRRSLQGKIRDIYEALVDLVTTTIDLERLKKFELYLKWLKFKTQKIKEEISLNNSLIPDLKRGDVILIHVGFNIGEEFGGEHFAIVLKNSSQQSKRVLVLPITSQEPTNKTLPIYVEIGRIWGMNQTKYHWANILNIRSISKQRILQAPNSRKVDGRILNRISGAIKSQLA